MATLEELQQQLAALQAKVNAITEPPDDYYTSRYSGEELDNIADNANKWAETDKLVSQLPGQNLLDNWYFVNPVDQRDGYVVPPGKNYYNGSGGIVGTLSTYTTVSEVNTSSTNDYNKIVLNEATYFVHKVDCVRGYTGVGYGIDSWWFGGTSNAPATVIIESDCVKLLATDSFRQLVENPSRFAGKKLTLSMLIEGVTTGTGRTGFIVDDAWIASISLPTTTQKTLISVTADIPNNLNMLGAWYYGASGTEYKIYAVKLELGSQQTLAHQDENGNWVLNEIPDYGEQLRRCQRYQFIPDVARYGSYQFTLNSSLTNRMSGQIPFPATMRTIPSLSLEGIRMRNNNNGSVIVLKSAIVDEYMSKDCFGMFWNVSVSDGVLSDGCSYSFMDPIIFNANL